MAKNQVHHAKTKHIGIRFHFIKEIVGNGEISLQKVDTKDNPVDMLTKIVPAIKFNHYLDLINILYVCVRHRGEDKVDICSLLDLMVFKSRWRIVGYDLLPIDYS